MIKQEGNGIRTDYRPSTKKLLQQVGNEKVMNLTLWREPVAYSRFIKLIRPDIGYDDLFHLSLNINGKYNLEKDGIGVVLKKGGARGTKMNVKVPNDMTINELLDKTKKRMGDKDFFEYTVSKLNCQNFIDNVLTAIGSNSPEIKKFVNQDIEGVVNKLGGKWASALANAFKTVQEAVDIAQEGGSCQCSKEPYMYNNQLPYCKNLFN